MSYPRLPRSLSGIAIAAALTPTAFAAPLAITSITTSPASTALTPVTTETTLLSVTTSAGTLTDLVGGTASGANGPIYFFQDFDPGSLNAAISGLSLTTASPNSSFQVLFNAASGVTAASTFFIFEIGGDDDFVITPIDANGATVGGGETLTINPSDYGPTVFTAQTPNRSNGGNASSNSPTEGVTFTLDDFGLSLAPTGFAGFQVASGGSADPVFLGGTVIPEPASVSLVAVGIVGLLSRRRRA